MTRFMYADHTQTHTVQITQDMITYSH